MTLLLLASASPRRAALLTQIGLRFTVVATGADESWPAGLSVEDAVVALAARKAAAAAESAAAAGAFVLAADTVGALDGRVLGKPADDADAARLLARLAGRTHTVVTGVVARAPSGRTARAAVATRVTFAPLSAAQIAAYVATGEPRGKAGAYAIQGAGGAFVRAIDGDYGNVVGLPLRRTVELLAEAGYPLPAHLNPS